MKNAVLLLALFPSLASAHAFTIDQLNDPASPSAIFINQPPLGQEFTPTLSSLSVVELMIMDSLPTDGIGSTVTVNIRGGAIAGPVLGTSTLVLPNAYGGGTFALTHFDFLAPVPLVPGNLFVMELVATGTGFTVAVNPANTYAGGRFISLGNVVQGSDLVFREGPVLAAVPEPTTLLLVGVGTALTAGARRRRARADRA
jgi:hypothetical protein